MLCSELLQAVGSLLNIDPSRLCQAEDPNAV